MDFKGKKVTVMGLGLHGGGVACVSWLIKHGAEVTVTDLKTKQELKPSLSKLTNLPVSSGVERPTCKLVLGRHRQVDFKTADLVVQNPGVPRNSQYLKVAKKAGVPIENDASLFFKNCPGQIIGVTGTRGKSTTATLIYELLKNYSSAKLVLASELRQYLSQARNVWLAGLPGQPMMGILDQVKAGDIVVLELSSWQLEVLGQKKISPHLAVLTNIYPDHLNRYSSMAAYIAAKKNIFLWQNHDDLAILNWDNPAAKKIGRPAASQLFWFSKKYFSEQNGCFIGNNHVFFRRDNQVTKVVSLEGIKLIGEHNLENILAAVTVAGLYQVSPEKVKLVLTSFSGLPGRLKPVGIYSGRNYINDTTATIPDATMAALRTFSSGLRVQDPELKNIVLIAGGASKNIPRIKYQQLARLIKQKCKAVILFSGAGSDQLLSQLKKIRFKPLTARVAEMAEAVSLAKSFSKKGDLILLSPACASFGLFVNEFDRGDQFEMMVKKI